MNKQTLLTLLGILLLMAGFQACQKENDPVIDREAKALAITRVELLSYALAQPDGSGWDFSTGPDVFLVISQGTSVYASDRVTSNANNASGSPITFNLSTPKTITALTSTWSIGAFDADDFDPDDYIGGISFVPADYQDDLPETILLTVGQMQMRLHVTWNF